MHVALGGGGGSVVQHGPPPVNLRFAHDAQRRPRPAHLALQAQQVALGLRLQRDLGVAEGALRKPARLLPAEGA